MKARIISACILVPVVVISTVLGGWPFLALVLVICGITAWEFGHIFDQHDNVRVPLILLVISVIVLILDRCLSPYSDTVHYGRDALRDSPVRTGSPEIRAELYRADDRHGLYRLARGIHDLPADAAGRHAEIPARPCPDLGL